MSPIDAREAEIAEIARSHEAVAELRQHITEIIDGTAFKGSHRSGQFLKYIMDQALNGHFESLKERVIGVELFGRSPSYDTGDDAIVRVTASDVRKRLLQHYGKCGVSSRFRIDLPLGSYIPEVTHNGNHHQLGVPELGVPKAHVELGTIPHDSAVTHRDSVAPAPESNVVSQAVSHTETSHSTGNIALSRRHWLSLVGLFLVLNLVAWGILWTTRASHTAATSLKIGLPWSVLFNPSHSTHLITSDPNIVVVQEVTRSVISLSDYANHQYIPEPNKLTPEEIHFCHFVLWGDDSAAAVDPPITAAIAAMAQSDSGRMDVRPARSFQLPDLKNDDNFIFLGSPRSDPWFNLFRDRLDFSFVFDAATKQEVIQNAHPRAHELSTYVPTALGWATGKSFAIIGFIQNPEENGQVLLLAGASGEGTEAAGNLVTNPSRLSPILQKCGINPYGRLQHFELLLQLNTMAGSPDDVDIVACHILPDLAPH